MKQKLTQSTTKQPDYDKYITTPEFNDFAARLKQENLASKNNIADFI